MCLRTSCSWTLSRLAVPALTALAILAGTTASHAQYFGQNKVRYRTFDFTVLETPHFDIYYYPSEAEAVRHAAVLAERWYDRISKALGHQLSKRQPLVLYDSHGDFRQTNVVHSILDEATGGFTEGMRNRMVLPVGPTLADTNHVIGHELVHAFQYDMARHGNGSILLMPLWFIEGLAEYFSVAADECQTAMWMRDAVRQEKLPTIGELASGRYFPYRYGHAVWEYLVSRFGEEVVPKLLRAKPSKLEKKLQSVTQLSLAELTADWHRALREKHGGPAGRTGTAQGDRCLLDRKSGGRVNVAPALSPDGRHLAYMSEKDDFAVDLFVADASDGRTLRKLLSRAANPRFDSLEFIESSGAWSPDGRQLAMAALRAGTPELVILDARTGDRIREYPFPSLRQVRHPSWSPDGRRIAFSGVQGGWSDLFVVSLERGELARWTHDAYSEIQPAWSPDGRTVAFATDRFSTSLTALQPGSFRLARLDIASGSIEELPGTTGGRNITPQWLPDGKALLFLSDHDGKPNIYRLDLHSSLVTRVTKAQTGVAGITALSPALSVAARVPVVAYMVYRDGGYQIHTAPIPDAVSLVPDLPPPAGEHAPQPARLASKSAPSVDAPASAEMPASDEAGFRNRPYQGRMALSGLAEPYFVAGGGPLGNYFRVGLGMSFSDMLGDRQLGVAVQGGRRVEDYSGRIAYINRARRLNWGASVQYLPALFARSERQQAVGTREVVLTTEYERQHHLGMYGLAVYPFNRSRRIEVSGGVRQVAFSRQLSQRTVVLPYNETTEERRRSLSGPDSIRLFDASVALVYDSAILGGASPILGRRYRFEWAPSFGTVTHSTVLADVRQYVIPLKPITVAVRARYTGRYGSGANDPRLLPLVFTLRDQVRGYDLRHVAAGACGSVPRANCSMIDVLTGSRLLASNIEVRAPLPGLFTGRFDYGPLFPLELFLFADAASMRTRAFEGQARWKGHLLRSVGAGVRLNLAGMVFEIAGARPFDRPGRGWAVAFNMGPGF